MRHYAEQFSVVRRIAQPRYNLQAAVHHFQCRIGHRNSAQALQRLKVHATVCGVVLVHFQQFSVGFQAFAQALIADDCGHHGSEVKVVVGRNQVVLRESAVADYLDYLADIIGREQFVDVAHQAVLAIVPGTFVLIAEANGLHQAVEGFQLVEIVTGIIGCARNVELAPGVGSDVMAAFAHPEVNKRAVGIGLILFKM